MTARETAGVARVIAEMVRGKTELDPALARMVAGAIAKNFKLKVEEVAILRLGAQGRQLEFVVPEELAKVGTIPITSTRALAVRTLRDRQPAIVNNFQAVDHQTVFESVKLTEECSGPIQKLISAPVLADGKPVGVIQISRKGRSRKVAGPDFTAQDADQLAQIAAALSTCLKGS